MRVSQVIFIKYFFKKVSKETVIVVFLSQGVPAAAKIDKIPNEVTEDTITLKWSEPQNNGKAITQYTVYQRIVTDGIPESWIKLNTITDVTVRELKVELESGKVYQFVVTATNELGESFKEDGEIVTLRASQSMFYVVKFFANSIHSLRYQCTPNDHHSLAPL